MEKEIWIRADLLLKAWRYLERYCADPTTRTSPAARYFEECIIVHPYKLDHWLGEIAMRAHSRGVLEQSMNEATRLESHMMVTSIVVCAIDQTSPNALGELGLSVEDKGTISDALYRFIVAVACGEISERDLAR